MALKLTVGVSKKVGQPNYGSLGAQCQLEYDMDITLLLQDREQFQQRVRQAYQACSQAVEEELARDRRGLSVTQSPPNPPAAASAAAPEPAEPRGPGANGSSASQEPGPNGVAAGAGPHGGNGTHGGNGSSPRTATGRRVATSAQVRALTQLAARRSLDLPPLLKKFFAVASCDQLSVVEASQLIHWLQAQPLAEGTAP